jgi:hypothetical protein
MSRIITHEELLDLILFRVLSREDGKAETIEEGAYSVDK